MKWRELLLDGIETNYRVAENLIKMVDDSELNWKPPLGDNWMTVGQLLYHITESCGLCFKGFVTGEWGFPADFDPSQMKEEDMLPPAESMKSVSSVSEALQLLASDKEIALSTLASCSDERLETEPAPAMWDQMKPVLGKRLLEMILHLQQHKGQLFYYLKMMGRPVNTNHLWGSS
ncbi:MAG: DinB family protein [bacterium]|nr:DinB family protein [bacterium]